MIHIGKIGFYFSIERFGRSIGASIIKIVQNSLIVIRYRSRDCIKGFDIYHLVVGFKTILLLNFENSLKLDKKTFKSIN
jgi:hypothetical protein